MEGVWECGVSCANVSKILWLASYPKSGNTWIRAFLANYMLNAERPAPINEIHKFAYGDMDVWPYEHVLGGPVDGRSVEDIYAVRPEAHRFLASQQPGIVFVKTHNRLAYFRDIPTITPDVTFGAVYVIRNPLDVVISYADHYGISIDQAIEASGAAVHALPARPGVIHQDVGNWRDHVLSWTSARGLYLHLVRFEDLTQDPMKAFAAIVDFLKVPRDRAKLERAIRFSSFGELAGQERKSGFIERSRHSERFFRQGRAGGWRKSLTPEQVRKVIALHGATMQKFGYVDAKGEPVG